MASKARELADVIGTQDTTENVLQGRRNLIINGAMQVWQRGTSGYATDNYASADRWKIARGTLSQQTFTAGSELGQNRNYANFDFSSSVFTYVSQPIEDVSTVAGKTITVSFYIKSNTLSNVYFHTYSQYGSGGSSVVNDKNFEATSITSSWQRITKTFDVTSLSGKTVGTGSHYFIGIYGSLGTALTGDFDIWGFQVEVGSVATPFEHRSYGEELALCQRYYWQLDEYTMPYTLVCSTNQSHAIATYWFPCTMRATPSAAASGDWRLYGQSGSSVVDTTTATVAGVQTRLNGGRIYFSRVGDAFGEHWVDWQPTGFKLTLDAEL